MATIVARQLKNGSMSYRATIRVMRGSVVTHRETRTFRNRKEAVRWSRQREAELKQDAPAMKAARAAGRPRKARPARQRAAPAKSAGVTKAGALRELGISAAHEEIYRMLLQVEGATIPEVSARMRASHAHVHRAMAALESNRLVINSLERVPRYFAAPPALAIEALMARREAKVRAAIDELNKIKKVASVSVGNEPRIEVVNREAIGQVIYQITRAAEREIVCMQRHPILLASGEQNDELQIEQLSRGVTFRTITDSSVLDAPDLQDRMRNAMKNGELFRLHPALPLKLLAVDQRVALLPLNLMQPDGPWLLVSKCSLLDAIYELFELLWRSSAPFSLGNPASSTPEPVEQGSLADVDMLLPMLVAGLQDKAIELELNISKRTLTRRMVELMKQLGASTRFQAGWLAAQRVRSVESDT